MGASGERVANKNTGLPGGIYPSRSKGFFYYREVIFTQRHGVFPQWGGFGTRSNMLHDANLPR